jgi:hypothetical protein
MVPAHQQRIASPVSCVNPAVDLLTVYCSAVNAAHCTCRYAMLSLGNIYFSNLEDKGRYDKHLQHAANFYVQVRTLNSSCIHSL